VRQAPRAAELGEEGERHKLRLELKLVADVGLVGLPNAGKSTLLSVITNARPEIASYAFTTLTPNLGMVDHRGDSFLVSDIPGLIEGASEGRGLGDEFLRHVERTAVLLHLIDCTSADVAADWKIILGELRQYKTDLSEKPVLIVLTKTELIPAEEVEAQAKILRELTGQDVFMISAQTHQGLTGLLDRTLKLVSAARAARATAALDAALPIIDETSLPDAWHVEPSGPGGWRVTGERIEGFARRTNLDQPDAVTRLRDILRKTGVARELRRQGAIAGDLIRIADREIEWLD
jgi:GTP-binding protein